METGPWINTYTYPPPPPHMYTTQPPPPPHMYTAPPPPQKQTHRWTPDGRPICRRMLKGGTHQPVLPEGKLKRAPGRGPSRQGPRNGGPSDSVPSRENPPQKSQNPRIARVQIKTDTPMCWLHLSTKKTYALVDSGADISLISKETFDKIPRKHIRDFSTTNCIPLQSVSGHRLKIFGTATLQVSISGFDQPFNFQIVEGLKNQCILGTDFLTNFSAQLDFGHKTLNLEGHIIPLRPQKTSMSFCNVSHSIVSTSHCQGSVICRNPRKY